MSGPQCEAQNPCKKAECGGACVVTPALGSRDKRVLGLAGSLAHWVSLRSARDPVSKNLVDGTLGTTARVVFRPPQSIYTSIYVNTHTHTSKNKRLTTYAVWHGNPSFS